MFGSSQGRLAAIAVQWGWMTQAQADACLAAGDAVAERLADRERAAELAEEDSWRRKARALFDRYLILRQLGAGATARAYLATDRTFDRQVVIKILRGDRAVPTIQQRFKLEIKALARLSHPNVVRIFDGGEVGGRMYLTMEYVPGRTLRELLADEQRPASEELVLHLATLADAIAHVHDRGIIHRDLKPANILIGEDGQARLLDFGLVRHIEEISWTGEHALIGTPQFMAPEQLPPRRIVPATDVYQLGAILYEVLAGHPPFKDQRKQGSIFELVELIRSGTPTPLGDPIAPELAELVMRTLARQPSERPSAESLARGLRSGHLDAERTQPVVTGGVLELLVRHPRIAGEERHAFSLADDEPVTIGRKSCTFRPTVRERGLSRHQCTIRLASGELLLENHSSNGTVVDGVSVKGQTPIGWQATLRVGSLQIGLRFLPLAAPRSEGSLVGREHQGYLFEALLSEEGEVPAVYRAVRSAIGRAVVIKTWDDAALEATARTRIGRAARLSSELAHPGFVQVLDAGELDGQRFIVTEYLDAPTLASVLERGPLAPAAAIELVVGLARAVAHAHRRGVIHRDIRPGNIFYDGSGAKLGGLGSIRSTAPDAVDATVGRGVGRDGYAAPEQLADGAASEAVDVYSLGAVLRRCVAEPAPELTAIIERCLAERPEARGSAIELVEALEGLRAPASEAGERALSQYRALLPVAPRLVGLELATLFRPSSALGGDFYDFVELDEGRLAIVVGKVSGDGLAAGLVVGMLKIALRHQLDRHGSPARCLREVNDELRPFLGSGSFAQVLVAIYDPASRALCLAGGPAVASLLATREGAKSLAVDGTAIGLVDGGSSFFRQDERDVELEPGDTLLLTTGGGEKLAPWFAARRQLSPSELLAQHAESLGARDSAGDDLTAVAAQVV